MKKNLIYSITILCASISFAQDTTTFESINLSPESYNNGSSGAGGFSFGNANFSNDYNASWGSWSGFSISNSTDNTTPGYLNDFSAITGGGHNSATYGVYYSYDNSGEITFDAPGVLLESMRITNTTFAALSMQNGDFIGKQFGSVTNAAGEIDGTNGEDFLKIWIYAYDNYNQLIDSIDFYLADYRFNDSTLDYILNDWTKVELSQLTDQPVFKLTFSFESSDMGEWGINTPTYFAMDNLIYQKNAALVENELVNITVFPNPITDFVCIQGEAGQISLFDVHGTKIATHKHSNFSKIDTSNLPAGIYFLEWRNENGKLLKKIIK